MPAHSTMCIWHIGLALTSHNLLRIKNSVYMYIILFRTTQIFLPSPSLSFHISPIFLVFFAFCWCERCEKKIIFFLCWGVRKKKEKWENAATRNIQNNVYFNVLRLPMSPCSSRYDWDTMYIRGNWWYVFCSTVEMWVYGKDALCCLARKRIQRRRCPIALNSFTNTL